MSGVSFHIHNFYAFFHLSEEEVKTVRSSLEQLAAEHDVLGLVILAQEGLNTTYAAQSKEKLESFTKKVLASLPLESSPKVGVYVSSTKPFLDFKVKVRKEIVTYSRPDIFPDVESSSHLSPDEWDECLSKEDVLVLDVRNDYETRLGVFEGALDLGIKKFTEFDKSFQGHKVSKDKKILMYCTGGIRCEKAAESLQEQGYSNVYQLKGGILNYLKEHPNKKFQGECFVFDARVSVDQDLSQTKKYRLCPHCGDPADQLIECSHCTEEALVCQDCLSQASYLKTCSKNCAHHKKLNHSFRRIHKDTKGYPKVCSK